MSWLVFAFSGPVLWAISTHLDKYLVEQYFKHSDVAVLLLFTAFLGVLLLPFIAFYDPDIAGPDAGSIALIMLAGLLYMGALLFYLWALQFEEASVVSPFFQAAPLFGYVLAYLFLGETLSVRQMAGGVMIVAGTLIVSVRFERNVRGFKLRLALLMLACGFALALGGLIFKFFAIRVDFWTTTFWLFVGQAVFGCVLLMFASYRRQLLAVLQRECGRFPRRRRIERTHQSRRLTGIPLCATVRAAEHRAGHRQYDHIVRVCVRRRAQRCVPAVGAGDVVVRANWRRKRPRLCSSPPGWRW